MQDIFSAFDIADSINVYTVGVKKTYKKATEEFIGILKCWDKMLKGAYDMPAFGVSLNDLTLKEMESGRWIEFEFGRQMEYNGMPFEKLLIQVESVFQGFNLIRYNKENGYDGRCFYINLVENDMSELSDYLSKIGQN